jgi:hypothetical protein
MDKTCKEPSVEPLLSTSLNVGNLVVTNTCAGTQPASLQGGLQDSSPATHANAEEQSAVATKKVISFRDFCRKISEEAALPRIYRSHIWQTCPEN